MTTRVCTPKQLGDACEMLVAAEMTLCGMPAMRTPDCWPHYDVIAQPPQGGKAQRVSLKSRTFKRGGDTFVSYNVKDEFDWLAIALLPGADQTKRQFFIVPRDVADKRARKDKPTSKTADERY
jgi:hypothetical protein